MDFSVLYQPITATPFRRDRSYLEAPPGAALRPFVRCFWRQLPRPAGEEAILVIPDTCVDIIFHVHEGAVSHLFCAMYDRPFFSESAPQRDTFAIRFYPWAAAFFCEDTLAGSRNQTFDAGHHFPSLTRALSRMLLETEGFDMRCERAEAILLKRLRPDAPPPLFLNAVYETLLSEGRLRVNALAQSVHVGARQLERLFDAYVGVSPKQFASMVRYQCLWREAALSERFNVQDAVERYGFTDQAHLLHQFKAYHSLPLAQAVALAKKHVAFLQSGPSDF